MAIDGVVIMGCSGTGNEFKGQLIEACSIIASTFQEAAEKVMETLRSIGELFTEVEEILDKPRHKYKPQIKHISKRALKVINSKTRTVKRLQRARESHRKVFEESEVEE